MVLDTKQTDSHSLNWRLKLFTIQTLSTAKCLNSNF